MADLCNAVDCGPPVPPAPARVVPPRNQPIDYMARDFDSLLRAMLDLLPSRVPGWRDRTEADLGMAVVEVFAYLGDQLAYAQDRVANEAFLRPALLYDSVRRHLSLIDYRLDPGRAAGTLLAFRVTAPRELAAGYAVRTDAVPPAEPVVFETSETVVLHPELNAVALGTDAPGPGPDQVVLAADVGATLRPGAWLFFEHGDQQEWARVAAPVTVSSGLPATTTVSLGGPLGGSYPAGALVRGNGVPATHGTSHVRETRGTGRPRQRLTLDFAPLTHTDEGGQPVSSLAVSVDGERWVEVEDFIQSGASDPHYRVSRDNEGFVAIEFGDGRHGMMPPAGAPLVIRYRAGIGERGLVAAGTLIRFDDPDLVIEAVVNPLPSQGARDPESPEAAKLAGPARLRTQERAVTSGDFEAVLARGVMVNGALVRPLHVKATFRWTGSWTAAVVSVEMPDRAPLPGPPAPSPVRDALLAALAAAKLAGDDVRLENPRYAALHIALVVHVEPAFFARHVRDQVQRALGASDPGGFFAPRRFTFGQDVYLSDLYAAVMAVEGVQALAVTRFKRLGDRYPDREQAGFIAVDPLEIARCDSDPTRPEHGILFIRTRGGQDG
ncbi:MAG: putative baseplate assembly protein [Candidatus Rokuibacteriota bacterium]